MGYRINIDALAMDAARFERMVVIARNPPHVAIRIAGQRRVACLGKLGRIAAAANVVDHAFGQDLLAVEAAVVADHLAKAGQIAQRGVQATAA
ncbi:hypothetical protein D8815_10665 [Streptococcus gordonii]|nr:hypothetical protein D8815_10665 [Streptococcus gordonii]